MILSGLVDGFRMLLSLDVDVWHPIGVSLRVSLTACVLSALIALPLGVALGLGRFRGRHALRTLVQASMSLPTVLVGLVLYGLLCRQGLLGDLGLLYAIPGMVLGQAVLATPIMIGFASSALEQADPRIQLTALSLGASRWRASLLVAQEHAAALVAAVAAGFGRVFTEVGAAMLLGGNIRGHTRNITTGIAFETGKGEFARGVAMGVVLLIIALGVNLLLAWRQPRVEKAS
ncbi:MAG: ABC transporter permease [Pseudomonadota bacterium]